MVVILVAILIVLFIGIVGGIILGFGIDYYIVDKLLKRRKKKFNTLTESFIRFLGFLISLVIGLLISFGILSLL